MSPLILGLHILRKCFEATWFIRVLVHCASVPCIESTGLPEQCHTQQTIMVHPESGTQRATCLWKLWHFSLRFWKVWRSTTVSAAPVISAWIIRSPKSAFPPCTLQLPGKRDLLTTCLFACLQTWIYLYNLPKTPELLSLLQAQEAEQCPGLTDQCSSGLKLKKIKLYHNLPQKGSPHSLWSSTQ